MKIRIVLLLLSLLIALTECSKSPNIITLHYGTEQVFQFRHSDINILGRIDTVFQVQKSVYSLNKGEEVSFYIKGTDSTSDRISQNRLTSNGDFNIEIPIDSPDLKEGLNNLRIIIVGSDNQNHTQTMSFTWDSAPVTMPLDLTDLSDVINIQDIGQAVNGTFEIDHTRNIIKTREPVGKDVLLLLGSPNGSQEATYAVRFYEGSRAFLGLSDFFAGHEAAEPPIGIKPGWSSAGLATLRPNKEESAQIWLAWGDLLGSPEMWVVKTDPPIAFDFTYGRVYRVRHQVLFENGINSARFRIWPDGEQEPEEWICQESDADIPDSKIKFNRASFGLFQFFGKPTEWFDIRVRLISE